MGARLVLLSRLLLLRVHVDHEVVSVLATKRDNVGVQRVAPQGQRQRLAEGAHVA